MVRLLLVVMVCALLPRWALAQDTAAPTPTDETLVAPPLVPAPEQEAPEESEASAVAVPEAALPAQAPEGMPTGPRILLETLAGGAGTFAGGLGGLVLGIIATDCSLFETDCTAAAVMGLSGMALGTAFSTWGAGSLMRGRGGLFSTLLGAVLGTGAGLVLLAADTDELGGIGLLALPTVGAVMGYELSHHADLGPSSHFSLTQERMPVVPTFGTTQHGGFMGGVAGRF